MIRRLCTPMLFLLLTLVPTVVYSATSPMEIQREALAGLDSEWARSGVLYDRALVMSGLDRHDGSADTPLVGPRSWRQMVHEMRRASFDPTLLPDDTQLRNEARLARESNIITIGVLDLAYDRIRPDALEQGRLVWNGGQLQPASGTKREEILASSRVFAASTTTARTYHGSHARFTVPRHLYLGSDTPHLEIDFADGTGFRPVEFDREIVVHYKTAGPRTLTLRATFEDGQTLFSRMAFEVAALAAPLPTETWFVTADVSYQGVAATGEAYVYLAPGRTQVTDPVIVAEGFDLDNTMNWDELYDLLNRENMVEDLRAAGFDAVVLNFSESTQPIQRNAYLLAELIQQVKAAMPDQRDIAVIGASMGGLVARYALAWMEDQGLEHRARTFISFDSPQTGANIPLGMQYWLQLFQIESTEAGYLLSRLDTPAARQMLLYHHTNPASSSGQSDPLRGTFLADLATIGDYPAEPRRVAVANGSGLAANQGFGAGQQIIYYEYNSILVDLIGNVWAVPDGNSKQIFRGLIDRIWPLPNDELNVTVSGTLPWDNAPGGYRGSMADMDATEAPYGDIIALHDNHCFIPTISALALDTTDPFFQVAAAPDLLAMSPFDAVYYPQTNQEHVLITAENKVWLMDEIARDLSAVDPGADVPLAVAGLRNVYPNPFNPMTTVSFETDRYGPVRLEIFDAAGRKVRTLFNGEFVAGIHETVWNGLDDAGGAAASGVYFVRLETNRNRDTLRMTLVR